MTNFGKRNLLKNKTTEFMLVSRDKLSCFFEGMFKLLNQKKFKSAGQILLIPQEMIKSNPNQPRKVFSATEMEELTQSVKENGIIQPITVRRLSSGSYELIAGERRLRAARNAGLKTVPCILMNINDIKSSIYNLIENLQRCNLNFFEEAQGFKSLLITTGITQDELSKILGKSQSYISNKLRLLKLNEEQQIKIIESNLTERHARCLLSLETSQQVDKVLSIIADKHLSVSDSERLVQQIINHSEKKKKPTIKIFKDVRLFINTLNHAVDTMRKAGIEADSIKSETDTYIEYVVRIPKLDNLAIRVNSEKAA